MLKHKDTSGLVESLNDGDWESKILYIFHTADVGLYPATTQELRIVVSAASNFVKESNQASSIPHA